MDYRDRHVVITGGTGALGTAVVAALIESGASCHIPFIVAAEAERFSFRDHQKVKLLPVMTLADEAEVARLYDGVPQLWASIHLAGGFAMAPLRETRKSDLMQQLEAIAGGLQLVAVDLEQPGPRVPPLLAGADRPGALGKVPLHGVSEQVTEGEQRRLGVLSPAQSDLGAVQVAEERRLRLDDLHVDREPVADVSAHPRHRRCGAFEGGCLTASYRRGAR